jgi:hypothetical protein
MISFKLYPQKQLNSKGKVKIKYPLSTNDFYSGRHWTFRKTQADYWHKLVKDTIEDCKINVNLKSNYPASITIYFNNKYDIDNNSAMAKLIIDGMKGLIIQDDTRKFVRVLTLRFYDEDGIKVEVDI